MRFSIGKLMLLVAICAVNFFLLGKVGSNPINYGVSHYFGELIILGGLPMLDLLGVVALIRKPGCRSLDDFLIGGGLALLLYLGFASVAAGPIREATLGLLNVIAPLGNRSWFHLIWRVSVAVLTNVLPQVAVATLVDRWIRRSRVQSVMKPTPDE